MTDRDHRLAALIRAIPEGEGASPEELRVSWARGNLMFRYPTITRSQIAAVDRRMRRERGGE